MWTIENRARYDRSRLRYPSDLTDAEWALIELHIPPAKPGGNKRTVNLREIANGLMYICGAGTARSTASITRSMSNVANERRARLPRRPRSSIARA